MDGIGWLPRSPFQGGLQGYAREDAQVSPYQLRDALLLKTSLEGKDFQTARKELAAAVGEPVSGDSISYGLLAESTSNPPSVQEGYFLELTQANLVHLQADIQTADGQIHVEATSLTYSHLEILGSSQPLASTSSGSKDPLVLDMDGQGPKTTGQTGARAFDLAGNGDFRPTSFVTGGSAFLALDRNGNGQIDSGLELFGDQHGAANGFEELSKFDDNGDHQITKADPVFGQLQLLYGDGRQMPLSASGIQALSVAAHPSAGSTSGGDSILHASEATTADGRTVSAYALGLQRFDQTV